MSLPVVGREDESRAAAAFLDSVTTAPAALVIDGEPGIGKTTLWSATVDHARARGIRVLTTRAAAAESVLAYAALADLLSNLDTALIAGLPAPQHIALNQVLLRDERTATDQRAVAAGFLAVITELTAHSPVVLALDDIHWLDPSSRLILDFAARRLSGPVELLATVRTDAIKHTWPSLSPPFRVHRTSLPPLTVGALHAVLIANLGRSFPRPTMVRIAQISGGNPFFALELAQGVARQLFPAELTLPPTLTELIRDKVRAEDPDAAQCLLAAACLATPTVETIGRACECTAEEVIRLLCGPEERGIVEVIGNRVRFGHPIFALGVHDQASASQRRAMHRRLAGIVDEPELAARHLALGGAHGDALTLQSLDIAAESARRRGAPAAAAELIDLAIGLGGDTPTRRILLAQHNFSAGSPAHARSLLEDTIATLAPGPQRAQATTLLAYVRVLDDNFPAAVELLQQGLPDASGDGQVLVPMLITLSFALFNAGRLDAAITRADEAVHCAERLDVPSLLGQALGMRALVGFLRGDGVDDASLRRACRLEDVDIVVPSPFRPRVHDAVLQSCSGNLEDAHAKLTALRQHYLDRGEDGDLMLISFHAVLNEVWRGDIAGAETIVADVVERAEQLGSHLPTLVALSCRALVSAYAGREAETRRDVAVACDAGIRAGSDRMAEWAPTALGFLEVSLGHYEAALEALKPMLHKFDAAGNGTEIIAAAFIPDAVEAMAHVDRCDDAEPLVGALERNGRRLGRPWMLAMGARGRAILLAADGAVPAALAAAEEAMRHHDNLAMPFERARTELVLGQLQRRQRRKDAAAATLTHAADTFDRLGTPLWSGRARTELGRVRAGARSASALTPSELQVAELAATGMTIRKVAATMFISPKTVEATLSRVYAKLGIHSRAELGRHMSRPDP